jgi:hypothetical protein
MEPAPIKLNKKYNSLYQSCLLPSDFATVIGNVVFFFLAVGPHLNSVLIQSKHVSI